MTPEQQVVSLELDKKLKELGVKQESVFYYHDMDIVGWSLKYYKELHDSDWELSPPDDFVSAFTVAELGEMLPMCEQFKTPIGWVIRISRGIDSYEESADTEADARAKVLIYLIENKLINN